jgi:SAM-dependent methyltransferase
MDPLVRLGALVDGVDFSERMIRWARHNSALGASSFFVSRGNDCGDAPDGAYDLAYSQLCFRYIRSRTVRNELLSAIARALKPGGVAVIELRFFPGLTAATVPPPHVPWSADVFESAEPATADVCPTPDELHLLIEDFSRHFNDLRLQFVDVPKDARTRLPQQLFVSGSVGGDLASRIHARPTPDEESREA